MILHISLGVIYEKIMFQGFFIKNLQEFVDLMG